MAQGGNCLSVSFSDSQTPISSLPGDLQILAMTKLRSFASMYRDEFEAMFHGLQHPPLSSKNPTYLIELGNNGKEAVIGCVQIVTKGKTDVVQLVDHKTIAV